MRIIETMHSIHADKVVCVENGANIYIIRYMSQLRSSIYLIFDYIY